MSMPRGAAKFALILLLLTARPFAGQAPPNPAASKRPPRHLPALLQKNLAACFGRHAGTFSILSIADDNEAYRYAEDWRDVLVAAGWKPESIEDAGEGSNAAMTKDNGQEAEIPSFHLLASKWTGMRVAVHDDSPGPGESSLKPGSPEQNFSQCVAGKLEIPTGGRIIRYKDRPSGSIAIQISSEPE